LPPPSRLRLALCSTLFPYSTLFRSVLEHECVLAFSCQCLVEHFPHDVVPGSFGLLTLNRVSHLGVPPMSLRKSWASSMTNDFETLCCCLLCQSTPIASACPCLCALLLRASLLASSVWGPGVNACVFFASMIMTRPPGRRMTPSPSSVEPCNRSWSYSCPSARR